MSFVPVRTDEERCNERKMTKPCFHCKDLLKHTSFKISSREMNGVKGIGRSSICYSCSKTKYPPRISYGELQEKVFNLEDIIEEFEARISEIESRL